MTIKRYDPIMDNSWHPKKIRKVNRRIRQKLKARILGKKAAAALKSVDEYRATQICSGGKKRSTINWD